MRKKSERQERSRRKFTPKARRSRKQRPKQKLSALLPKGGILSLLFYCLDEYAHKTAICYSLQSMKLRKLLKEARIEGSVADVEITGICCDSKRVAPGNLFIAKKGLTRDGAEFTPEA